MTIETKEKIETNRKIRDYQRELINWMYPDQDERGDERQLADMYMYEDQGGQ